METVRTLLFPFQWRPPFVFLSIFQLDYLSVLQSPMPFLLGLPRDFLADATVARACRSVLLVDVDNQAVSPLSSSHSAHSPREFPRACLPVAVSLRPPSSLEPSRAQTGLRPALAERRFDERRSFIEAARGLQ